mgnify:CR=1 FL=1
MRDVSGSMGEFEKYISRSFYFWMLKFLRTKYERVQVVFITHHTEAKEVDEETFFRVADDKTDDGIIQNDTFGVKRAGELDSTAARVILQQYLDARHGPGRPPEETE